MSEKSGAIVLTTCPSEAVAQELAESLLTDRLAACVNILPNVKSLFWWEGKIDSATEYLLIIKCLFSLSEQIVNKIQELHPYDVPPSTVIEASSMPKNYLKWIMEVSK